MKNIYIARDVWRIDHSIYYIGYRKYISNKSCDQYEFIYSLVENAHQAPFEAIRIFFLVVVYDYNFCECGLGQICYYLYDGEAASAKGPRGIIYVHMRII